MTLLGATERRPAALIKEALIESLGRAPSAVQTDDRGDRGRQWESKRPAVVFQPFETRWTVASTSSQSRSPSPYG